MMLRNPTCGCHGALEGILETALAAPDCVYDTPTSATVIRLRRDKDTKALLEPEEDSSGNFDTVTVYNSDPDLTGVEGAYCRWQRIGGIYQFTYVGCEDATEGCGSSSSSGTIR